MLYALYGEDDFSIKQALEKVKTGCGDPAALANNTTVLDGKTVTMEQLRHSCETVPFLADCRLVIIEGLAERFEARGKPGRKKGRSPAKENGNDDLSSYLSHVPDFTTVVLLDGKLSEKNPVLRVLADAKARMQNFPLMKGTQRLAQWVEKRVGEGGGSISPRAAALLAEYVGSNLWAMANEIDKLLLFTGGRGIEEQDVREVVSYVQEANIFALTDAILEFRGATAQGLLQRLLNDGTSPSSILVFLTRQVRMLVNIKEIAVTGVSRQAIQSQMGIASDFVFRKAVEQAGKYSLARLVDMYHRLLDTDLSIKTGTFNGELVLDILVAELGQRREAGTY